MKKMGIIEHPVVIAKRIHRLSRLSLDTPTKMLKKLPSCFATKKLQKFVMPVRIANIEASIFTGINLAKSTLPERRRIALERVSVTVLDKKTKVVGLIPYVKPRMRSSELSAPKALMKQQTTNITDDSVSLKNLL